MTVRARFAPSPTGLLHIGGARTALFNYLFARHHGGEFVLRIEDTDRLRNTEVATRGILESLDWLGLARDGPAGLPVNPHGATCRSRATDASGREAYHCYCTPDELRAGARAGASGGTVWRYDGRWRDRDPSEAPPGIRPVIRLKAPRDGETVVDDIVQGTVRVANSELDDMIILRSDGTPTYNHSVVVDDHDMGITHVIRGDEHLNNAFRQVQIYQAMDWDLPRFAHIPLIHGADGTKLSKRHGAVSVLEFREQGYLPEALCNYLMRLGWGHGDAEVIDRAEAIRLFDLDGIGRSPSRMDYARLTNLNGHYIRHATDERLTRDVLERLAHRTDLALGAKVAARIRALMPALKERAKTLVELADAAAFLARPLPLPLEPKAAALLTPEARMMLRDVAGALAATDFTPPAIDAALRAFAESSGRKLGQVAQPLRAALTGSTASPGIDATVAALGKDEALARLAAVA